MLDAGDRSCAMEASSHASELHRLDRVRFAALVFTNLSQDHLDFHGTWSAYFEAKRRLFLETAPPAAVNVGDAYGRRLADELRGSALLTFGFADDAEAGASIGRAARARRRIALERLRGRFNVENALGALAAARLLGIDGRRDRARRLESVRGRAGPLRVGRRGPAVPRDRRLRAQARRARERAPHGARARRGAGVICVFGCGGDRDRGKRPLMGRLAAELADVAIVTSDNPRSEDPDAIIAEIVAGAGERRGGRARPRARRSRGRSSSRARATSS